MTPESLKFLKLLLDTPGPSSFEAAPGRIWRAEAQLLADSVEADVAGNSFAILNSGGSPRLMLAGHIDEIGIMITHIDDEGFLSFDLRHFQLFSLTAQILHTAVLAGIICKFFPFDIKITLGGGNAFLGSDR